MSTSAVIPIDNRATRLESESWGFSTGKGSESPMVNKRSNLGWLGAC